MVKARVDEELGIEIGSLEESKEPRFFVKIILLDGVAFR